MILNHPKRLAYAQVAMLVLLVSFCPCVQAKRHKAVASATARASHNCLVPPPPAYTPAWLPEDQYYSQHARATQAKAEEPSNPYAKYIYTAPGHEATRRVQVNKYVTVWSKTNASPSQGQIAQVYSSKD
jgi:hypothetical protein